MQFSELGLAADLLRAVAAQSYTRPTPIQAQAIPIILKGRDVLAGAQTGTGKTAAFALPILQLLSETKSNQRPDHAPRTLVLTPTRELAAQVADSFATYGAHGRLRTVVVFGGVGFEPQKQSLRRGVDILVATPGRLLDHAAQGTVDLSRVEILVLDEADRMLDMGFIRDIRKVLALLPGRRQNLLFSATYSDDIKRLADSLLHDPALIEVARRNSTAERVTQEVYRVEKNAKRALLVHLIVEHQWSQVLVFTRTKHGANRLSEQLNRSGVGAAAIHGNKSQSARTRALADFKAGAIQTLVATDIAARGLDIDGLPHVVHYELPNVAEDYVHRIGRTGRAGESGQAVSLVGQDEVAFLRDIERLLKRQLPVVSLPEFPAPVAEVATSQQTQSHELRKDSARVEGRSGAGSALAGAPNAGDPQKPRRRRRPRRRARSGFQEAR